MAAAVFISSYYVTLEKSFPISGPWVPHLWFLDWVLESYHVPWRHLGGPFGKGCAGI